MARFKQMRRLPVVGQRILTELNQHGLSDEAAALEQKINTLLATLGLSLASAISHTEKARLPAKCSYCGGTIRPDEVDWFDNIQAACTYCGSLLQASS
jgi:hypothetical protein